MDLAGVIAEMSYAQLLGGQDLAYEPYQLSN